MSRRRPRRRRPVPRFAHCGLARENGPAARRGNEYTTSTTIFAVRPALPERYRSPQTDEALSPRPRDGATPGRRGARPAAGALRLPAAVDGGWATTGLARRQASPLPSGHGPAIRRFWPRRPGESASAPLWRRWPPVLLSRGQTALAPPPSPRRPGPAARRGRRCRRGCSARPTSNGPRMDQRRPRPSLISRSMSSGVATPSRTRQYASRRTAPCRRLKTKPSTSRWTRTGDIPTSRSNASAKSTVNDAVNGAGTNSTTGSKYGGLPG